MVKSSIRLCSTWEIFKFGRKLSCGSLTQHFAPPVSCPLPSPTRRRRRRTGVPTRAGLELGNPGGGLTDPLRGRVRAFRVSRRSSCRFRGAAPLVRLLAWASTWACPSALTRVLSRSAPAPPDLGGKGRAGRTEPTGLYLDSWPVLLAPTHVWKQPISVLRSGLPWSWPLWTQSSGSRSGQHLPHPLGDVKVPPKRPATPLPQMGSAGGPACCQGSHRPRHPHPALAGAWHPLSGSPSLCLVPRQSPPPGTGASQRQPQPGPHTVADT